MPATAGANIHGAPVSACGSGPCRPSLALSERSEWATADRVGRGRACGRVPRGLSFAGLVWKSGVRATWHEEAVLQRVLLLHG